MVAALKRVTTEFVEAEDRLRLSGEVDAADPVVLWLTQRLALRLLPPLFQWLDHQTGATSARSPAASPLLRMNVQQEIVHGFAQEAAKAGLKLQPPVQAKASGEAWLVNAIDLTPGEERIALVFKGKESSAAGVALTAMELRQWLAILHGIWTVAQWPTTVWPEWIQGEAKPIGQQIVLH